MDASLELLDPEELLEIELQNEYAALNNGVHLTEAEAALTEEIADVQGKIY